MNIKRFYIKKLLCGFLCALMLTSLFSCTIFKQDELEGTESQTEDPTFALTSENISEYKIVVPEKLMQELSGAVETLQKNIKTATGAELDIKSDYLSENSDVYCESEYEIIIGSADRAAATELYKSVRNKDVGYAMIGKKLLILGNTEALVSSSVRLFKKEILSKAESSDSILLYSGESKIDSAEYKTEFKINGVNISEYTVVYPFGGKLGEKTAAAQLCKWIEINTGYAISYVADTATEASEYEIQVGNTNRITDSMRSDMEKKLTSDDVYYASKTGDMLWVTGKTKSAVSRAALALVGAIASGGELKLDSPLVGSLKDLSITVMSYNIRGMLDADKRDSEGVIDSIRQRDPDIFAPQEATTTSAKWISRLDAALGEEYQCVKGLCTGSYLQYQPIYFKKDRFELVSSSSKYLSNTPDVKSRVEGAQYERIVTFVVLRDKQTGIEFLYSNNHFDTAGYIVRTEEAKILAKMLENYPLLPQIVGGDFNTESSTTPIQTLTSKSQLTVGEKIAEEAILGGSGAAEYVTRGESIIDIVLVTADSISIQKYEIWDNKIDNRYPSDHLPVCVELTVKY